MILLGFWNESFHLLCIFSMIGSLQYKFSKMLDLNDQRYSDPNGEIWKMPLPCLSFAAKLKVVSGCCLNQVLIWFVPPFSGHLCNRGFVEFYVMKVAHLLHSWIIDLDRNNMTYGFWNYFLDFNSVQGKQRRWTINPTNFYFKFPKSTT